MIETRHGTVRISYRKSRRPGRIHTIVNFIPKLSIYGVVESFRFSRDGEPLETNGYDVATADVANDSRDQFVKVEGRRRAIALAISRYGKLNKVQRTEVWEDLRRQMKL